jgi:hypothetical protein
MRTRLIILLLALLPFWSAYAPDETVDIILSRNVLREAYRPHHLSPLQGGLNRLHAFFVLEAGAQDEASRQQLRELIYLALDSEQDNRPRHYAVGLLAQPHMADEKTIPALKEILLPTNIALISHTDVTEEAARTVGRLAAARSGVITDADAIRLLIARAKIDSRASRGAPEGIFLIGREKGAVREALAHIAESDQYDQEARIRAVELLWLMGAGCPIEALRSAVAPHSPRRLRRRAAEAMMALGYRREGVAVLRDLIRNGGFNSAQRVRMNRMIRGEEQPTSIEPLGHLQDDRSCALELLRHALEMDREND